VTELGLTIEAEDKEKMSDGFLDSTANRLVAGEVFYVNSSNVDAVWYENETQILFVKFLSGATYAYYDVELNTATAMILTSSQGKFVWQALRGKYRYNKL
jgi:hypothetical protein